MNFKTLLVFLVMGLNCIAQQFPYVTVIENDTVIVFSFSQGLELSLRNEELKKYKELYEIQNSEVNKKDEIILSKSNIIQDQLSIIDSKDLIIDSKTNLLSICEEEKLIIEEELSRQRRHKRIALASGFVIAVVGIIF